MESNTGFLNPSIVALGFYDGATEGFTQLGKSHRKYYFKLIAWDKDQDQRLFVISEVESSLFSELIAILIRNQQSSSASTWIPNWQFNCKTDERDANNIVNMCEKQLFLSNTLLLGEGINDVAIKKIIIDDRLAAKVHDLLDKDEPDKLENWIPNLNEE